MTVYIRITPLRIMHILKEHVELDSMHFCVKESSIL